MRHPIIASLILLATPLIACAAPDGEKCQGILELGGKGYKLQYAAAYAEKVLDDKEAVSVIFSESAIPVDKLRASLRESGNADKFFHFKPHVTVTFDKSGKAMFCNAWADNNSLGVSGSKLSGKLEVKDGRARGETALASDGEDDKRKSSFKVPSFDLPLLVVPVEKKETITDEKSEGKPEVEKPGKSDDAKGAVNYRDLPLPDGATDVEYKKIVGHIRCKSPADIKATAGSLTEKLVK